MKFVFIADFFADEIIGGGELNNEELINILIDRKLSVKKINSHLVTVDFIEAHKKCNFIISNFVNLSPQCREALYNKKYVIYEHDHKYLKNRNPAIYPECKAPDSEIVNYKFYKEAAAVLCQSGFHQNIVYKNLKFDNIVSLGGNLWSLEALSKIREYSHKDKLKKCSIMDSPILHKNTGTARAFCAHQNMDYELIPSLNYYEFLDRISNNDTLVFFPKTPETLSRIVVEARMMGMKVITNKLVGATREEWFSLKGAELIDIMIDKREMISEIIIDALE